VFLELGSQKTPVLLAAQLWRLDFCENYKAAIAAVQQGGKNFVKPLSSLTFGAENILVLQVSNNCLLLSPPMTRGSISRKSFGAFGSSLANLTNFSRANSMERLDVEMSE
jgi:hypothetical protein